MHDDKELSLIKELMEQLTDEMEYGEDDFAERLGKGKPGVTVLKIEGKTGEDPMMEKAEEKMGMDLDGDMEEGESPMHKAMVMGEDMSPDDKLKQRLMRLRG